MRGALTELGTQDDLRWFAKALRQALDPPTRCTIGRLPREDPKAMAAKKTRRPASKKRSAKRRPSKKKAPLAKKGSRRVKTKPPVAKRRPVARKVAPSRVKVAPSRGNV